MGNAKSSKKKLIKPTAKLPYSINCPFCNQEFTKDFTFYQFNQHLLECGNPEKNMKNNKSPSDNHLIIGLGILNKTKTLKEEDNETTNEKLAKLHKFITTKKEEIKESVIKINCKNEIELFETFKKMNIYQNFEITFQNQAYTNLNIFIDTYFEFNIKMNNFSIIHGKSLNFDFESELDWELLGIVIACLIVYPNLEFKYKFPILICRLILDKKIDLNDLQYLNNNLYDELRKMKEETNVTQMGINFSVLGDELIFDGHNIRVNENNLGDFIEKRANYEAQKINTVIIMIKKGISKFISKDLLKQFTSREFYNIINRVSKI